VTSKENEYEPAKIGWLIDLWLELFIRMLVRRLGMPMRFPAVFVCGNSMLLRFRMPSLLMVMRRLAVMVGGVLMMSCSILMMLARWMFCRHDFLRGLAGRCRVYANIGPAHESSMATVVSGFVQMDFCSGLFSSRPSGRIPRRRPNETRHGRCRQRVTTKFS
jgi:hypothetical protein